MTPSMLLTLAGSQHGTPMQRAIFGFLPNATNFYLSEITIEGSGQYIYRLNGVHHVVELEDDYSGSIYIPAADAGSSLIVNGKKITEISQDESQKLITLDISGLTDLTSLVCRYNSITTLDVSGATALTSLDCSGNSLTTLDVSGATALTSLSCSNNSLTTLDVSMLTALASLDCSGNSLTTLDVSGATALTSLNCSNNSLTTLDVTMLTALASLNCYYNSLETLDVSGATALTSLNCSNNSLTTLDVSGLTDLTSLLCNNNISIVTIKYNATQQIPSIKIANLITEATSTTGTVYLNSSDEYYQTVATAATNKGWTIAAL